jgi:hypothetical protein
MLSQACSQPSAMLKKEKEIRRLHSEEWSFPRERILGNILSR